MKVVIAGGSGFLGRALIKEFGPLVSELVVLSTSGASIPGTRTVHWEGTTCGDWQRELESAEAVVNYVGFPIVNRWTSANRRKILSSRIDSTVAIGSALSSLTHPPKLWVNGSASGYYGDGGDAPLTESSPRGVGFLADVAAAWEKTAEQQASQLGGTKLVRLRTGVVIDREHPPLSLLLSLTNNFAGGSVGSGVQYMPWIYVKDHARLVRFCIEHRLEGPINAVAPQSISNGDLMAALRNACHRPWAPPVPAAVIQLLGKFGFPAEAVLNSTRAVPARALESGFTWIAPAFEDALGELGLARR